MLSPDAWAAAQAPWLARAAAWWAPRESACLTLRAWFQAPLAWDAYDGLTLEGTLQAIVVLRATGEMPDDVFADAPRAAGVDIPIPIVDVTLGGLRIACASQAQPAAGAAESTRWRRKRARDVLNLRGFNTSGGAHKSLNLPTHTLVTPYVDFHVVGDARRLVELLPDASEIGRSRAGGLGAVLGWEVLLDLDGRSLVWGRRPMRVLPAVPEVLVQLDPGAFDIRPANTRAPYWHRRSQAVCVVPASGIA